MIVDSEKIIKQARVFEEDLLNSNNPSLRESWINIFRKKFGNDCVIFWKDEKNIQVGMGTDLVVKTSKGRRYSIELKTRNYNCLNNNDYIMELVSHIYDSNKDDRKWIKSKEGWIYSTTAEYVFHATLDSKGQKIKEVIFYSLCPFKNEKYKSEFSKYKPLWLSTQFSNGQFQLTLNKLIPKEIIKKDAMDFWEWKDAD